MSTFRQKLPTPDRVTPAPLPTWREQLTAERLAQFDPVADALSRVLDPIEDSIGSAVSAVLVVICSIEDQPHVVLTRRASHLRNNAGDVSFPGGRREGDETIVDAAIRETYEEVALQVDAASVIGVLASTVAARREISIAPVVAVVDSLGELQANADEVDEILVVPLTHLVQPGVHWCETWSRAPFGEFVMHHFAYGDDEIWGATAYLLHDLLDRLAADLAG